MTRQQLYCYLKQQKKIKRKKQLKIFQDINRKRNGKTTKKIT